MTEKGYQIADCNWGSIHEEIDSEKFRDVNNCLEVQFKDDDEVFISHKIINPRSYFNQDRLHPNKKGQYMMEKKLYTFINTF